MTEPKRRPRRPRVVWSLAVLALLGLTTTGLSTTFGAQTPRGATQPAGVTGAPEPGSSVNPPTSPANVILILTDDLSENLLPFLPQVQKMQQEGASFRHFHVADSLCCPSRASLLTGKYPHNTGVLTNGGPYGGFAVFRRRGESNTLATDLSAAGYRTALLGKYLNGYAPENPVDGQRPYIPPGWSEWGGVGLGYAGFNYLIAQNSGLVSYGTQPQEYLTDVLGVRSEAFIRESVAAGKPFFLKISTFTPHSPYVPAPQDRDAFPGLTAPRTAAFGTHGTAPPAWLAAIPPLSPADVAAIDTTFRRRAQTVQSIDRMIAKLRQTLRATGQDDNTYLMFTSDNGYHLGEYGLLPGKQTAHATDTRVPLVVTGPGVRAGAQLKQITSNIDLRSTITAIAGTTPGEVVDGRSLLPLLRGEALPWRDAVLVEHRRIPLPNDPDNTAIRQGSPPSYRARRTVDSLYVEYSDGQLEYYDTRTDPDEINNIAGRLSQPELLRLHTELSALARCQGHWTCE